VDVLGDEAGGSGRGVVIGAGYHGGGGRSVRMFTGTVAFEECETWPRKEPVKK
jgi:hypothetical protein